MYKNLWKLFTIHKKGENYFQTRLKVGGRNTILENFPFPIKIRKRISDLLICIHSIFDNSEPSIDTSASLFCVVNHQYNWTKLFAKIYRAKRAERAKKAFLSCVFSLGVRLE